MQNCIKSLEDSFKVATIQRFFGVTYNKRTPYKSHSDNECTAEENMKMVRRISSPNPPAVPSSKIIRDDIFDKNTLLNNVTNHVETGVSNVVDQEDGKNYSIKYKFWYYFFISVTYLGDVIGYALVLPFLFWNVDGVIGRKLVLVWTTVMYVGQAVKEIVCKGRPECPPVIRLQKRWSEEYGLPSTHAMAAVTLPSSLLYYGSQRYEFRFDLALIFSVIWCALISFSRLYLGMHSILDVVVGFLLSFLLLIPLLPLMDFIGDSLVAFFWSPPIIIAFSLLLIGMYPKPRGPMTAHTRADTTIILATCVGVEIGFWLNYHLSAVHETPAVPYIISTPDWKSIGYAASRTVLGLICIVISLVLFEFLEKITYRLLSKVTSKDSANSSRKFPILHLFFKYLTFSISSFHVTCSIPFLFKYFNIHRSSYFTE